MFGVFSEVSGEMLTKGKEPKLIVLTLLKDQGTDQVKPSTGLCFYCLMTYLRNKKGHIHYYSTIHVHAHDKHVLAQPVD